MGVQARKGVRRRVPGLGSVSPFPLISDDNHKAGVGRMQPPPELAVRVRGAFKDYGESLQVLRGLDMSVPVGRIYALLGSSGCGKTTLLMAIIGRLRLRSGHVHVFGVDYMGARGGRGVPAHVFAYMPQETGLPPHMTVRDTVYYFSWLHGVRTSDIEPQYRFLKDLLELPGGSARVETLSGGELRRLSFAACLVHRARLLILDEPTVGLDPLLRQSLWDYLFTLSRHHVTVIITTHYIEEARQAHVVGLMRHGRLLSEARPSTLLRAHGCSTLEEAFLSLCREGGGVDEGDGGMELVDAGQWEDEAPREAPPSHPVISRMKALLYVNLLGILRNKGTLAFVVLFPLLQVLLLFPTVGELPRDERLAVVNQELTNQSRCGDSPRGNTLGCHVTNISCTYLDRLASFVTLEWYPDVPTALLAASQGRAVAVLHFGPHFSAHVVTRGADDPEDEGAVSVYMDMTNTPTAAMYKHRLTQEFQDMAEDIVNGCNGSVRAIRLPMMFNEPVYGEKFPSYRDFMLPRHIMAVIYIQMNTMTAPIIVTERRAGIWERNIICGVSVAEVVAAHTFTSLLCSAVSTITAMAGPLSVHGWTSQGGWGSVMGLLYLQGVSGMCLGLLISVVSRTYVQAMFVSIGTMMAMMFLSGSLWPLQGLHPSLQAVAYAMPYTVPGQSLGDILVKGWGVLRPQVLEGFLISGAWVVASYSLAIGLLRIIG